MEITKCTDTEYMKAALSSEGFAESRMKFDECLNVKTQIGFFSIELDPELKYPVLTHFFVDQDKRSYRESLKQFQLFTDFMIKEGIAFFIVEAPEENTSVKSFIKWA